MRSRRPSKSSRMLPHDSQVCIDAAEWLVRLQDTGLDPEEPYPDPLERQNAFIEWLTGSPMHVRAFLEIMEVERRAGHPDPQYLIKIQELLDARSADVIQLYDPPYAGHGSPPKAAARGTLSLRRKVLIGVAAGFAILTITAGLYLGSPAANTVYITGIGEQRTAKLRDGSVIVLNTDTEVQVYFSKQLRNIRLLKGEALFMVEHDTARPFIVSAGNASVRAVGTEFNVRRREQSTEVAVVEGVVQVSTLKEQSPPTNDPDPSRTAAGATREISTDPAALRLAAGEKAQVSRDGMKISSASRARLPKTCK
jgi:ferric-dicitrate binding protein FerR (iron transport regulator)